MSKGFTLIELLLALSVVGIAAAIIIPLVNPILLSPLQPQKVQYDEAGNPYIEKTAPPVTITITAQPTKTITITPTITITATPEKINSN